jgi:YidC/Oxa1 family membrane protein insertase
VAIIMLTVLVRGCMFPMSIKQARGAQKMQELQPEIKKLNEKYKNNAEAKVKAQQELFKKHNYNPLSGCLVFVFQLPIFIGLYRGLMVDVELRQAPLLWEGVGWCSNLAAPDMLFEWGWLMPAFVTDTPSTGLLGILFLGPYFNLLPLLTIGLFLIQQKMFMPPPADEQAKMQHTMMKFMMIFMGFVFFKVAAGLCLYFIASSLWGVAERKLLPKTTPRGSGDGSTTSKPPPAKPARQIPQQPKPALPGPGQGKASRASSDNGGAGGGKKKKKRKKSRGRR